MIIVRYHVIMSHVSLIDVIKLKLKMLLSPIVTTTDTATATTDATDTAATVTDAATTDATATYTDTTAAAVTINVNIPALAELNQEFLKHTENLLNDIRVAFKLSAADLAARFLKQSASADAVGDPDTSSSATADSVRALSAPVASTGTIINPAKCRARTDKGNQCSRNKKEGKLYCGGHEQSRPNGDYN